MFTKEMKKIVFAVMTVLMFVWVVQLSPMDVQAEQDGFWTYYKDYISIGDNGKEELQEEVAYISKYSGAEFDVVIPEKIGGCKVKGIMEEAFNNNDFIETVDIPSGVTIISYSAFGGCENLKEVTGAENVKIIGDYAFAGCSKLESYPFSEGLKEIGTYAFRQSGLKSAHLPESVETLGDMVFHSCTQLQSLTIPAIGQGSSSTGLMGHLTGCKSLETLCITGSGYTGINACKDFTSLKSVYISEGITHVGSTMFEGCTSLVSVELPKSLKEIDNSAFVDCTSLCLIQFHEGLEKIGSKAFYNCNSLTTVEIPNTVVEIESYAFKGANMTLGCIVIPNSVTKIGKSIITSKAEADNGITPNIVCYEGSVAHTYAITNGYAVDVRTPVPATSFTANSPITLGVKETVKLQYTMLPTNHTDAIVWQSSDKNIATVDNLGNITGKKPGQVSIVGTSTSGLRLNVVVKVSYKPSYIRFRDSNGYSTTSVVLAKGASKAMKAVVYDNGGQERSDFTVTYTSSNPAVVSVAANGTLTGKGAGTATITASCEGVKANLSVKVVKLAKPKTTIVNGTYGVDISWKAVEGADSYTIYRKTGNGKMKKLATKTTSSTGTITYTDKSSKNGKTYSYAVEAVSGNVKSGYNKKGTKILRLSSANITSIRNTAKRKVTVSYGANGKATGYEVYYSGKTKKVKGAKNNYTKLKKLKSGKYYTFKVRAYKKVGKKTYYSAWSKSVSKTIR